MISDPGYYDNLQLLNINLKFQKFNNFLQSAFCLDSEAKGKSKHESVHGVLGNIKLIETFDFHTSENLIFPPQDQALSLIIGEVK